jgi:hypothetical protein
MELRKRPPRSKSMSLRGPTVQATRQKQRLSPPEWTRNALHRESDTSLGHRPVRGTQKRCQGR